jgi:hypothetical protein
MSLIDVLLFEKFERKPTSFWEVLKETLTMPKALKQQKALYKQMCLTCEGGVDADEMPNGIGEFGTTLSNPIPCKTIFGSRAYLSRLRTADGLAVAYTRVGHYFSKEVTPHPIDCYRISNLNGAHLATLYLSPYQKRVSRKAPKGFLLKDISFS